MSEPTTPMGSETAARVVALRKPATPGQTVGPFFGYALPYPGGEQLVPGWAEGAIRIHGTVFDGAGQPVPDALVEIWQSNPEGSVPTEQGSLDRDGHGFTGWGRAASNRVGEFSFSTLLPGTLIPGSVPFIAVVVFARGLLDRLHTRLYLPNPAWDLAADPFLARLAPERRSTLIAVEEFPQSYRFDIHLQGTGETVFLDFRSGSDD